MASPQIESVCPECEGQFFITQAASNGERQLVCWSCGHISGRIPAQAADNSAAESPRRRPDHRRGA